MILTLTASIMYWSLQHKADTPETIPEEDIAASDESPAAPSDGENAAS